MKNKILVLGVVLLTLSIVISISFIINRNGSSNELVLNEDKNLINNSFLTLMLEQEDGTYAESTSNTWPSGNYAFNSELSRCENGGELEWDREQGIVKLLSNKSDGCYVYFDLYNVVQITNVQTTKTTNSITLTVTVEAGENPVATYYFSIDGGRSYQESNTNTYTFSNLDYGTTYTIQVYAVDSAGYESNEEVIEVTTDNYVNPVVNSVTTSVSNNSITVSVLATTGTNAIQTYYYSINNEAYVSSTSNTYTFSGLNDSTVYNFRVYVRDTNGVDSNVYTINAETENPVLLADYIKGLYTSQGSNGIYYHTSSLANSAGDNSYRYAGANPNNYVCFGIDTATCPEDNLYRIIGVFGSEVKLIKVTPFITTSSPYGSYSWSGSSSNSSNVWSNSTLNTSTLNTSTLNGTYLNSFSSIWQNKIAIHSWQVGGMDETNGENSNAKTVYNYEVGANGTNTTYSAKIGLIYVSDYGFAASPSHWTLEMSSYNYTVESNWMYMEGAWTITRTTSSTNRAFGLYHMGTAAGSVIGNHVTSTLRVYPVFYLSSDVEYSGGVGSESDPIRID